MRKKFGQNFLVNPDARGDLLEALEISAGDEVWEIGPGLGAMTAGLLERGGKLTAFEIDPGFCKILKEMFGELENFRLIEGDAAKTWPAAEGGAEEELCLFGNLPYNAGASLLGDFIEKGRFFKRMVVTVQKEVADRMCAKPGSSGYSSFSVLCSSVYALKPLKVIKGASFYPVPRVDSRAVRLDLLPPGERERPSLFYPLVRALFSSRRKTIKNSLSVFIYSGIIKRLSQNPVGFGKSSRKSGPTERKDRPAFSIKSKAVFPKTEVLGKPLKTGTGGEVLEILRCSELSGDRRPETLNIEEFTRLAEALEVFHGNRA
jgi:16S rRNA (adenine1518-N6/adenine1519-N6)-dimethyltransferase